jgi:hypothetical protein
MNLFALPAFTDHFIGMLHHGSPAVVVDPGPTSPTHAALVAQASRPAILVTPNQATCESTLRVNPVSAQVAHNSQAASCWVEFDLALARGLRRRLHAAGARSRAMVATPDNGVAAFRAPRPWKSKFR